MNPISAAALSLFTFALGMMGGFIQGVITRPTNEQILASQKKQINDFIDYLNAHEQKIESQTLKSIVDEFFERGIPYSK